MRSTFVLVLSAWCLLPSVPAGASDPSSEGPYRHFAPERREAQQRYEESLLESADEASYRAWHDALSSRPHVAGTPGDLEVVETLAREMEAMGLEVERQELWLYLPRPVSASVEIVTPERLPLAVQEDVLAQDPYSDHPELTFGWNAYSGSGTATGHVVYAHRGTKEDFERLADMGVDLTGKIVLARYGGNFRGYKAKFAEAAGAEGLLMYLDPKDYGYVRGLMWPDGGWAHESSIQRGSILTLPYSGDPLTPFEPATKDAQRLDPARVAFPTIAVQPIGWDAAGEILRRMTGEPVPEEWQGGLPFNYRLTGGDDLTVKVTVEQTRELTRTYNVTGTLRGERFPEETLVVGCHHDAWSFGAGDPNAGSIVVLGAARSFAEAARRGHRPDRTLVFAHWGAEEQGILGSVEWVEAHRDQLSEHGVAYVNLDMAAMGLKLGGSASPTLKRLVADAADRVPGVRDPEVSALDEWTDGAGQDPDTGLPRLGDLGGGSDHVGFYAHLGVPSASVGARGSSGVSYHTNYEDLAWYRHVVGRDYRAAKLVTSVVDVLVARLAEADVLPLDPGLYGPETVRHLEDLEARLEAAGVDDVDLTSLKSRAEKVGERAARVYGALLERLAHGELTPGELATVNRTLTTLERRWIHEPGIPDRPWFRSLYASTDADSGYAAWMLPLLRHAAEHGDGAAARRAVGVYEKVLGELDDALDGLDPQEEAR